MQHIEVERGLGISLEHITLAVEYALGWEIESALSIHHSVNATHTGVRVFSGLPAAANKAIAAEITSWLASRAREAA